MKYTKIDFKLDNEEVKTVVKLGGYYYWDWKFPFRHFKEEELIVVTNSGLYKLIK